MGDAGDSQLMNIVVRMVVPMRREFGRSLDVQQFLRDRAYAEEVLATALSSQDPRLLEYARYAQSRLLGARATAPASRPGVAPAPAPDRQTEDELRAKVLKKYTGGLR